MVIKYQSHEQKYKGPRSVTHSLYQDGSTNTLQPRNCRSLFYTLDVSQQLGLVFFLFCFSSCFTHIALEVIVIEILAIVIVVESLLSESPSPMLYKYDVVLSTLSWQRTLFYLTRCLPFHYLFKKHLLMVFYYIIILWLLYWVLRIIDSVQWYID